MSSAVISDPFLQQLIALCAAHPTRGKWVIVPTHAIGRTIGDRLAVAGSAWANLRFVTPLDLALRMGAPFLVEQGVDPSEEGLGPALAMRLLLDLPAAPGYFRPLAEHPTMAQALWRTLRELRMAGVGPADLAPDAFTSAAKHAELHALFGAYLHFLAANRRGDMATVYEEALRHPDWCPIGAADCWTTLPHAHWTILQQRLLEQLPGEYLAPRALALPGVELPRRLVHDRTAVVAPGSATPLAFLLAPDAFVACAGGVERARAAAGHLELFRAGGIVAEVEEVCRRIHGRGLVLDQVEIACARDEYAALLWEKACRFEWPATLASGVPATLTRPGRALVGLVSWVEDGFAAGGLRRLLQSSDIRLGEYDLAPGQAARVLVQAEPAWGRETYALALERHAARYRLRMIDLDRPAMQRQAAAERVRRAETLQAWIRDLLAWIPDDADGEIELQLLVDGVLAFIATSTARTSALDHAAAEALSASVAELKALGAFRCSLAQGLRFVLERAESVHVGADRARPGHLHVTPLAGLGFSGRPHLFVVGLEEGRVFPAATEDPVLLDAERRRISPHLRLASDRVSEAVFDAISRMASTGDARTLCLSYSCRDLREFRETYPSWLLLQAHRVRAGGPAASYADLQASLGTPASAVPAAATDALTEGEWWLHGLTRAGDEGQAAVLHAYPALARGRHAEAERDSDAFTEFDGHVPEAGPVLDPCAREGPVSPTELEDAAKCPFRHFLQRGLGLISVEDEERSSDTWLDPLTRGSLLHDLYARLLRRARAAGRRVTIEADGAWFEAAGRAALDELRREMPPPSAEVFEREQQDLLADLSLFVAAEAEADPSRTPIAFEVSFGRADDGEELLARREPIEIPVGQGLVVRLAGRIDRIDQVGPDAFEIVDYKTGGYFAGDWQGSFAGGTRLQHALYGLAAVQLLQGRVERPRVVRGVYYFPTHRGGQERQTIDAVAPVRVTEVLRDLREVIAQGLFVHASDDSGCKWCQYGAACGRDPIGRAAGKVEDDARLEPRRKLAGHA